VKLIEACYGVIQTLDKLDDLTSGKIEGNEEEITSDLTSSLKVLLGTIILDPGELFDFCDLPPEGIFSWLAECIEEAKSAK
jgi:hypothetical protein